MKRLYVTVGSRVEYEGDKPEDKGEFLAIDWETKKIVGTYIADSGKEVEVGRSRGATGLAWHEGRIYITCRHGLMSIDPDTYEEATRSDSAFGGFHGMDSDGHTLWLTAHGTETILGIRNDKIQAILCTTKYHGSSVPRGETNGVNAVGFSPSGEMFIMYSHKFHIFNWTKQTAVLPSKCEFAPHDITFVDEDHCLYSQSSKRKVFKLNVRTGEQVCVIDREPLYQQGAPLWIEAGSNRHSMAGWLRGIAYHKDSNAVFVLSAPGTILEYDASTWKERASFSFTKRLEANPFDIILDPRDWK